MTRKQSKIILVSVAIFVVVVAIAVAVALILNKKKKEAKPAAIAAASIAGKQTTAVPTPAGSGRVTPAGTAPVNVPSAGSPTAQLTTDNGTKYAMWASGQCSASTGSAEFPPGSTLQQAIDICKSLDGQNGHGNLGGIGPCKGIADYGIKLSDGNVYPYTGCLSLIETGGSGVVRVF